MIALNQAHSSVECQGSGTCSRIAFVCSMRTRFTSWEVWENFTHKNQRKQRCMWTRMLNSRVSYILWGFCPAQVGSPSKSGFYCRRTTRHLLWVMTTLHIGAGRKWGVNERNNSSHMAKMLSHFNCAAERSRLDLCQWKDNLLLWFMNVPLQNLRSRN